MRRAFDPFAPPVDARFETMRRIADAGVPVGVALAPVIPGVNDASIPSVLERAAAAGARMAFMTLVRLPREVAGVFDVRLEDMLPQRASKVKNAIREMRGGRMNDARFGSRMRGTGARWTAIEQLFEMHARRLGIGRESVEDLPPRPKKGQLSLL
jgi:DNA repair photolyase